MSTACCWQLVNCDSGSQCRHPSDLQSSRKVDIVCLLSHSPPALSRKFTRCLGWHLPGFQSAFIGYFSLLFACWQCFCIIFTCMFTFGFRFFSSKVCCMLFTPKKSPIQLDWQNTCHLNFDVLKITRCSRWTEPQQSNAYHFSFQFRIVCFIFVFVSSSC